jgi:hypothetical protein
MKNPSQTKLILYKRPEMRERMECLMTPFGPHGAHVKLHASLPMRLDIFANINQSIITSKETDALQLVLDVNRKHIKNNIKSLDDEFDKCVPLIYKLMEFCIFIYTMPFHFNTEILGEKGLVLIEVIIK